MRGFDDLIRSLSRIKPPLAGRLFTWSCDWQPPTSAKVDKFLFSLEWEEKYPSTYARTLPYILSDHIPILIDSVDIPLRPAIIRFENM